MRSRILLMFSYQTGACLPILRIGSGIFVVPFWVGTEIVVIGKQDYFILELQI